MIDIRRYTRSTILSAAEKLQQSFENLNINSVEYIQQLNIFKLRDISGLHWFLDPHTKKWYLYKENHWQFSINEPNLFEAPDIIFFLVEKEKEEDEDDDLVKKLDDLDVEKIPAEKVIHTIINIIRRGFDSGYLTSTEAQNLLIQQIIVDLEGKFWTQGIKSEKWYFFENRQWYKSESNPPPDDQLFHLKDDEYKCLSCGKILNTANSCPHCGGNKINKIDLPPEKIVDALPEFMFFGVAKLPESITDLWDPPRSFPDDVINTEENEKYSKENRPSFPSQVILTKADRNIFTKSPRNITYKCQSCGATVQKGQKFCTDCGLKLPEDLEPVVEEILKVKECQNCGEKIKKGQKFCIGCGEKL